MRAFALSALLLAACFRPGLSAYLAVPVATISGEELRGTYVPVPIDELTARGIHPWDMAVYQRGREPIPHLLEDTDGDGYEDTVWVAIDVPAEGSILTFLSPGPGAEGTLLPPNTTVGVDLLWDEAYR